MDDLLTIIIYSKLKSLNKVPRLCELAMARLEIHDILDGRLIATPVHDSVGDTQLAVEAKLENLTRPKLESIECYPKEK